jgi:hypothetical protein
MVVATDGHRYVVVRDPNGFAERKITVMVDKDAQKHAVSVKHAPACLPTQYLLRQKPVGHLRFSPTLASMGNAGHGLVCQPVQYHEGTLVEWCIVQIDPCHLLLCPPLAHGSLHMKTWDR